MDPLLNFLQTEKIKDDPSYEEQLEHQKILLLKQREVDDFKKIADYTRQFNEQLKYSSANILKETRKTKIYSRKLIDLKIEVQRVIDQNILHTMKAIRKQEVIESFKEIEHERMREEIDEDTQQIQMYQQISNHIRESKAQIMLLEAREQREQENQTLEKVRSDIKNIFKKRRETEEEEWKKITTTFVEISELYMQIQTREKENDALLQSNSVLRAKIEQLKEDIKQQCIQEEKDLKQQEIEMNERFLTPMKITHADVPRDSFKNPNDFPALIDKIELTRRNYENIFKRPEYTENMKPRKIYNKIKKFSPLFQGFSNIRKKTPIVSVCPLSKNKGLFTASTHNDVITDTCANTKDPKTCAKNTNPPVTVSTPQNKFQPNLEIKSQLVTPKNKPAKRNIIEIHEDNERAAVCNVPMQKTKRKKYSRTQPESMNATNTDELANSVRRSLISSQEEKLKQYEVENLVDDNTQIQRDTKRAKHAGTQPEAKNLTHKFEPFVCQQTRSKPNQKEQTIAKISDNVIPKKIEEKTKQQPKRRVSQNAENVLLDKVVRPCTKSAAPEFEEEFPQKEVVSTRTDSKMFQSDNSTRNVSPTECDNQRDDQRSLDAISLTSSTSSLDLGDAGTSSDFDLDFSLNGSPINRDGSEGKGSGGSAGSEMDFDFLNSPKSGSKPATRSPQQNVDFDFLSNNNDDEFNFF
ncbi:uncharacterized protein LOC129733310 [Wyeomyia smithii]|uniref:uncharacterized protein LOC129733310 n=1 Tax=Wyeomyia smithii TaxID=174621 RepID=UPI002467F619|nr:uncharacterized protein LOC129733310 [Wyeomyia smithii]